MVAVKSKYRFVLLFISLVFGIGLAGYVYLGSFMRMSGDDYCYGGVVVQQGFWAAQVNSYFNIDTYHGGRFSLTFFSGLATLLGPWANAVLPGLVILLWVLGTWKVLNFLLQGTGRFGREWSLLLAILLVFTAVNQMPDRTQSLYWRSGMLPYTAPLVGGVWLVSLVLSERRRAKRSPLRLVFIFLLGLLLGGFSETGAAFLITGLGAWTLVEGILARKKSSPGRWAGLLPSGLALLGLLASLALMWFSPVTRLRQASLNGTTDLVNVLTQSIHQVFLYANLTGRVHVASYVVLIGVFAVAGWAWGQARPYQATPPKFRRLVGVSLFCSILGILLSAACMAPSYFAQSAPPDPRALVAVRWVMILSAAVLAWMMAAWLGAQHHPIRFPQKIQNIVLILAIGSTSLLPLWEAWGSWQEAPRYQRWASFWDARHQFILQERTDGSEQIEVVELDHIINDVAELSPDDAFWYNNCAEAYYDVGTIRANQAGWDE